MTKRILFFLIIIFIFSSCEEKHFYQSKKEFDNYKWANSDKFISNVEINSIDKPFDIWFEINHNDNYPFENIYLRITDDFIGKIVTDTVNINLSNSYGIWTGKKSGKTIELKTILRKSYKFPKPGKYNIEIEQFTRVDSLSGVSSVGFFINENKVK